MTTTPLAISLRPTKFARIIGQPQPVALLRAMVTKNYHPRCILLKGPTGTGKTTLGRLYAALLNCDKPDGEEPCGTCYHCISIFDGSSSIVLEIETATHRLIADMDEVRKLVAYSVPEGKRRVIIADEFHTVSETAQESLLHVLEANSLNTTFVLTTTKPNMINDAILSRAFPITLGEIMAEDRRAIVGQYFADFGLQVDAKVVDLVSRAQFGLRSVWQLVDKLKLQFGEKPISYEDAQDVLGLIGGARLEAVIAATKKGLFGLMCQGAILQKAGCVWQDFLEALFTFAEDSILLQETGELRCASGVSEAFLASGGWLKADALAYLAAYFDLCRLDWKSGLPVLYTVFTSAPAQPVQTVQGVPVAKTGSKPTVVEMLNSDPVWLKIGQATGRRVVEAS